MLKSVDFMQRLESDLVVNKNENLIDDYFIELRINHNIDVYIASDSVKKINELKLDEVDISEFENKKIKVEFITISQSKDEDYNYLFEDEKSNIGLRRSLNALLDSNKYIRNTNGNIISFYSYKGGVGRTTSLALTATYLARKGKNVFVLDCDFEAPGIINFFNTSQSETSKSGLIEYLNDKLFIESLNLEDYVYNIEKTYSGSGAINMMSSGNILNGLGDLNDYLEGLAKLDMQGSMLIKTLENLVNHIQSIYSPDVILIDSRTGFNNVFGALASISDHVVVLAGDDLQNQPGIDYVSNLLTNSDSGASFVLSVLSSSFSKRFKNFENQIKSIYDHNADVFYFDRQNVLEFIGTSLSDDDDLNDFISGENGSPQYQKFFKHLEDIVDQLGTTCEEAEDVEDVEDVEDAEDAEDAEAQQSISLQDKILTELEARLPDLYAENIDYNDEYINKDFFIRPCMEDFFIPEKVMLLGDKGTGKTAFYKALQIDDLFSSLINKCQKRHLNYKVLNVTNFENDNFEVLNFDKYIKDELFIKKLWIFIIWNSLCSRGGFQSLNKEYLVDLSKTTVKNDIVAIIKNEDAFQKIEEEMYKINSLLKSKDERLIITFDRLDNIVKPYLWNDVVSPLVKLSMRFPWDYIYPKLFLRRDLYDRLGNLTNKNSFNSRAINLEWSQNEIFSYFLKIVFNYSKSDFLKFIDDYGKSRINSTSISKKLKTKNKEHNQLPLDTHLIKPIINLFFGEPKKRKNAKPSTAYDDLYRNIQSADKTVNLRPFIDLMSYSIENQKAQDHQKNFRKEAILGLAYCTSKQVRKNAVIKYLEDLWNEQGNEFVKYFCTDLSNNRVSPKYKKSMLNEDSFEKLLLEVVANNRSDRNLQKMTVEELKQTLIANKIITPYMVGSKTRYGFAYLYTNYFGL
ncbi:KGGVGR-motif variant AAA ATPase [Vibrio parahaemolyticus]|uniref:KGGVGR-motif variant AAA ATPase n=1 Tax=Vibrio parahaemolyticus TaxID=670 RepID=UPI0003FE5A1E|nr:AAA family ATPase [Vibrio parahaemolyticus]